MRASQKMRPTTAAFCAARFSAAGSPSSRAASTAWIEPGISTSSTGRASCQRVVAEAHDAPVHEHPDQLLGEERVAVRQGHHAIAQVGRQATREQAIHELGALGRRRAARGRWTPRWGCRRPTPGAARAARDGRGRGRDRALRPSRQVLDEVEQAFVGPVDVLLDEDQGVVGGEQPRGTDARRRTARRAPDAARRPMASSAASAWRSDRRRRSPAPRCARRAWPRRWPARRRRGSGRRP